MAYPTTRSSDLRHARVRTFGIFCKRLARLQPEALPHILHQQVLLPAYPLQRMSSNLRLHYVSSCGLLARTLAAPSSRARSAVSNSLCPVRSLAKSRYLELPFLLRQMRMTLKASLFTDDQPAWTRFR